jgi:putative transposon-encoded protein
MRRVPVIKSTNLTVCGISGFVVREVTPFGTSAKVSCPKEYLGRKVYLVFLDDES